MPRVLRTVAAGLVGMVILLLVGAGGAAASAPVSLTSVSPNAGPTSGGITVTLTGSGFQAGATVLFGSSSGVVLVNTPTQIAVTTPAHSYLSADVEVDNLDGGKASLPLAYHYYEPLPAKQLNEHPAVVIYNLVSPATHRLDVFGRGTDNVLYHNSRDSGGSWGSWDSLGGVLRSAPGAASWGNGRIDVFVRGSDDGLWHRWFSGGAWSGWEPLGGILSSAPAVASWSPNRLDVFVKGTDNGLWHKWWDGTRWSGYEGLGGLLASDPGAYGINDFGNVVDVFVRGTDNGLWHKWWDAGGWHGFEFLGPVGQALGSAPAATTNSGSSAAIFVLGPGSNLLYLPRARNGWKSWRSVGTYWSGSWAFGPAAVAQGYYVAGVDVIEVGSDGNAWHGNFPHPSVLP
jgi:hypothetical protein